MPDDHLADVLRISQEALAREGTERAAYLDATCGTDADLRHEVEALLAEQASGDGFLDTPPWQPPQPALMAGQRLGPYEVVGKIGAGGMGAVYKARDTRLARTVALKVIAGAGAMDPAARERFAREAKTIASLNHPHICALYDVGREVPWPKGEGGGQADAPVDFLVMEYLDGETLEHRLHGAKGGAKGNALKVEEAIKFATEIAGALAAAHDAGVVHRDLKPANIMLTGAGAKVLDFGLAKLRCPVTVAVGGSSATVNTPSSVSAPGLMVGTVAYMSPEQARGEAVDARSDIFAFGCVLYEMLSGERPFQGASATDILTAIVRDDPPPLSTPGRPIPGALNRIVRHCLEKDRVQRFESARDVLFGLEGFQQGATAQLGTARTWRLRLPVWQTLAVVAVLGAIAAAGWTGWRLRGEGTRVPQPPLVVTADIQLPADKPLAADSTSSDVAHPGVRIALSRDARWLAYVALSGWGTTVALHDLSTHETKAVRGSDGAVHVFFSPDGTWLGFLTGRKLMKARVSGGDPVPLCDVFVTPGAKWGENGRIYLFTSEGFGVSWVGENGGTPEQIRTPPAPSTRDELVYTDVLPGGRWALASPGGGRGVAAVPLGGSEIRWILATGQGARYVEPGYLVFEDGGGLAAVRFDATNVRPVGEPKTVAAGVARNSTFSQVQHAVGPSLLAFTPGGDSAVGAPAWVSSDGAVQPLANVPVRRWGAFDLSANGARLVLVAWEDIAYPWVYDFATRRGRAFRDMRTASLPVLSRDGQLVAYRAGIESNMDIFVQRLDREEPPRRVMLQAPSGLDDWSPDGRTIAARRLRFVTLPPTGEATAHQPTEGSGWGTVFSPTGRHFAYTSTLGGLREIWIRSFSDPRHGMKVGDGTEPVWCENGDLVFRRGNRWMATRVVEEPEPRWDPPKLRFETDFVDTGGKSNEVSPDGRRLLVLKSAVPYVRDNIRVIVNWPTLIAGATSK